MSGIPFSDFGIQWFEDIVEQVIQWFEVELAERLESVTTSLLNTPLPEGSGTDVIFSEPSDAVWHSIYESTVAGETMLFALLILILCIQGRHFLRIFNFGNAYEARKARRSSWTGAFLIITWYWLAVLSLYFVQALTIGLLPDMQHVSASVASLLPSAAGTPGITLIMAILGGLSMVALQAVFFIREVLLYVYLYGMPFGIAIAFGNIPVLSGIARRLCSQFIPLAVLPLPATILFRGYELLFTGEQQLALGSDFLRYLVVVSLPLIALYITWKTFAYASPLVARSLGTAGRGALLLGTVAGAGYVAGPKAAAAAARWGPKGAAGSALASRSRSTSDGPSAASIGSDAIESTREQQWQPEYRRTENDPDDLLR